MDCTTNEFCASLPGEVRRTLCRSCKRRFEKAGSIQLYSANLDFCMLILDGALCSNTSFDKDDMDHGEESPSLFLALPGRVIVNLGLFGIRRTIYEYSGFHYLTDTWIASFDYQTVQRLLREEPRFLETVAVSLIKEHESMCQVAALVRPNYTYYGTYHFMKLFEQYGLFVAQQDIADIMNHDRSSVSKAMKRIKTEDPGLWSSYMANKGRIPSVPKPGADGAPSVG